MNPPLADQKAVLRRQIRDRSARISSGDRAFFSTQICAHLRQQRIWQDAGAVLFYAPLPEEVDVWPLLPEALSGGKTVALPRYDRYHQLYVACQIKNLARDLRSGRFNVKEPATSCVELPLNQLDLILVPGVGFDLNGHRLGRGQGYYDRMLAAVRGTKCGLAFDFQVETEIPAEPHDVTLNWIVTPSRWWSIS